MPSPLPESVAAFLDAEIFSIPQLEVLLLLYGADGEALSVEAVAREFYLPVAAFSPWLAAFVDRGLLLAEAGGYRALPAEEPRAAQVYEVGECYAKRRISVTRHVYAAKEDPIRRFADAFRLRKDKNA